MTDNKRVTNKQILDKIDSLKVGEEGLNILAIKIVSRMVKLKSMEDWFHHVSKSSLAWSTSYQDLDVSDYGLFYSVCFEGFDECHSDDITSDEEDSETSSLNNFINFLD